MTAKQAENFSAHNETTPIQALLFSSYYYTLSAKE
jgi:hypothetical protein